MYVLNAMKQHLDVSICTQRWMDLVPIHAMRLEKVFPYELPLKVLKEWTSLASRKVERRDKHSFNDMKNGATGSIVRIDHGGVRASGVNGNRAVI